MNQLPFNKSSTEYKLRDLLNLVVREVMLSLNCHAVGTIQSFDSTKQTAQVTINYTRSFVDPSGNVTSEDYRVLVDVPVVVLQGGTCSLTFPIAQGDTCLVLFNDRDIDNWYSSGQAGGPVATQRLHSLADGMALVGIRSAASPLSSYDTTRAALSNGTTKVGVGASQVLIKNSSNGALGPSFTAFFTALSTFMSACAGSETDPTLAGAAAAFNTDMSVPVLPTAHGPIANIEGILE